jgi:hypothetical protein
MATKKRQTGSRSLERLAAAEIVADFGHHYQQDQNALWAWLAFAECDDAGLVPPAWALEYRRRTAGAVRELTRRPAPPDTAAMVRALELARTPGERGAFRELAAVRRELGLAARVWALALRYRTSEPLDSDRIAPPPGMIPAPLGMTEAVITKVAEQAGVSKATVWRAWERHGATFAAGKLAEKL